MKKTILIIFMILISKTTFAAWWTARVIKVEPWYGDNVEVTVETNSDIEWASNAILTVTCQGPNNTVTEGHRDKAYKLYKGKNQTQVSVPTGSKNCIEASAEIQNKKK